MKTSTILLLIASALMIFGLAACEKAAETRTVQNTSDTASAAEQTPASHGGDENVWVGKVAETMNSGNYTYVHLDMDGEKVWVAGPQTEVAVGQEVIMAKGMPMNNFTSKSLDRTFDVIYFVNAIEDTDHTHPEDLAQAQDGQKMQSPHGGGMGGMGGASSHTSVDVAEVEGIAKAEGGFTVAELFSMKSGLGGETVKLRGQVVKFTPNIMGTNWVHIQDGTRGDLTVTTGDVVAVGDVVLVEGPLTLDKDFGAGYRYDAIIEGAKVTKE